MTIKSNFNLAPDPTGQVNGKLSNAYQALKSKNPIEWEVLPGEEYLCGFTGCNKEKAAELIKNGKITVFDNGSGTPCFLVSEAVRLINEDPEINRISWESYLDKEHSEDEPIIHWKKYRYPDHLLIKYHFRKETFYAFLPPEFWRKNIRIGNTIIRLINKNLKSLNHE
jgi:hypothetical protein